MRSRRPRWEALDKAVEGFSRGSPDGAVPWGLWWRPLLYWAGMCGSYIAMLFGLLLMFRRRWIEHERLPFPWALPALSVIQGEAVGRRQWIAWLIGLGLCVPGIIYAGLQVGAIAPIPMLPWSGHQGTIFGGYDLSSLGLLYKTALYFYWCPFILAMYLLMPTDVLLTIALTYVLSALLGQSLLLSMGMDIGKTVLDAFRGWGIRSGGCAGLLIWGLYFNRKTIWTYLKGLVGAGRPTHPDQKDELGRGLVAGIFLAGLAGFLLLGCYSTSWPMMLFLAFWVLAYAFAQVRQRAEGMLFTYENNVTSHQLVSLQRDVLHDHPNLVGNPNYPDAVATGNAWGVHWMAWAFAGQLKTFGPQNMLMEIFKIAHEVRANIRQIGLAVLLAVVVVALLTPPLYVKLIYLYGFENTYQEGWAPYNSFTQWSERACSYGIHSVSRVYINPGAGNWFMVYQAPIWMLVGISVVGVLTYLRREYVWFPFSPVGFVLAGEVVGTRVMYYTPDYMWFTILLAWIIKKTGVPLAGGALLQRADAAVAAVPADGDHVRHAAVPAEVRVAGQGVSVMKTVASCRLPVASELSPYPLRGATPAAFAGVLLIAIVTLAGCSPSNRPTDASEATLSFEQVRAAASQMATDIRSDAERIADFGSRQTGQVGCLQTYEFVRSVFAELDAGRNTLKEFGSVVTVPLDRYGQDDSGDHTTLTVDGLADGQQVWQAYAFQPNNVQDCPTRSEDEQPRRLVDLRMGEWEGLAGQVVADAVVLLDYNSADAWLRAKELGAYAAIFVEPSWTNWRQSDLKYLATVPLYMPRVYVDRRQGTVLREALTDGRDVRVTIRSRLRWRNVQAPCVEFTIPGKDPARTYILAGHFDARSIVPDLAYGGDEVWGIAALVELARFFAQPGHQPAVNLRFMAVSGLWQAQRPTRDYIADGSPGFEEIGRPVQLVMGIDYSTEHADLNLIRETSYDEINQSLYRWLKQAIFSQGGWHDEIYRGLDLPRRGVNFYGDERPFMITTADGWMAPRGWLCPFTYSPKFRTANEAWAAVSLPTFAFQTAWLYRMSHNSPLDRFSVSNADARFANLQPQVEMTLAVLDRLMQYPSKKIPPAAALYKRRAGYNAYTQLRGRIQAWDPTTGWFSTRMPTEGARGEGRGASDGGKASGTGAGGGPLRTFIYANCNDAGFNAGQGGRERGYLPWPLSPHRRVHRELQSFMFDELRMLDEPDFRINALYNPTLMPRWTCWAMPWMTGARSFTPPTTVCTATATRPSSAPTSGSTTGTNSPRSRCSPAAASNSTT